MSIGVPMLKHNYYGNFSAEEFEKLPMILQRFLSYTQYDTTSDASSPTAPSTEAQKAYAQLLKAEFESVGVKNVYVTEFGIVMGFIEATPGYEDCPAMGLIAHMDTSPEASGAPAQWSVIDYQGGDIVLNKEKDIVLQLSNFPEVGKYAGQKLVVTDGTTLLGADDKAGIALCVEAARYAIEHPEIPHAKLCFAITPDEEISRGTVNFNIEEFGAQYAYTFDGDELGGFETETFNAAMVNVHFEGLNVHISGAVRGVDLRMLIRDHDNTKFEDRMEYVRKVVEEMNKVWGNRVTVDIKVQYHNLKNYLDKHPMVCDIAREAYRRAGVEIHEKPVRGGTDGARLSARGLPTPNLFTGGMNYHGVYECLSVTGLERALDVAKQLVAMSAEVKSLSK